MKLAEKIKRIADQISFDQNKEFGFSVNMYGLAEKVQTLLDERYNKPIDECQDLVETLKGETLIVSTTVANLFHELKSKLETMKEQE